MRLTAQPWYQLPAFEYERTPPWARTFGSATEARAVRAANANIFGEAVAVVELGGLQNLKARLRVLIYAPEGRRSMSSLAEASW